MEISFGLNFPEQPEMPKNNKISKFIFYLVLLFASFFIDKYLGVQIDA